MSRAHDAFVVVQNAYDNGWQAAREMENVAHKFECEADQMREERDAINAGWAKWADTSRCIYCGAEFYHDPHDQDSADNIKKQHILVCQSHPYGKVIALLRDMAEGKNADTWGGRIQAFLSEVDAQKPFPLLPKGSGA